MEIDIRIMTEQKTNEKLWKNLNRQDNENEDREIDKDNKNNKTTPEPFLCNTCKQHYIYIFSSTWEKKYIYMGNRIKGEKNFHLNIFQYLSFTQDIRYHLTNSHVQMYNMPIQRSS